MEYRPSLPRKIAGWALLALGLAGAVLPILQGALFIALGLFILRHQYEWAQRGFAWAAERWPRAADRVEGLEARLVGWTRDRWAGVRARLGRP